jgi:hypothetical protein
MTDTIEPGAADGGGSSNGAGGSGSDRPPPTAAAAAPPTLRVVQLPQKREVTGAHLENLRASGLTDETIRLAALYVEAHPKRLADLMQIKHWRSTQGTALVLPFYLPGADEPHAYRIRPQTPRIERRKNGKERAVKYDQPRGSPQLVYFPPRARVGDWYSDAARALYWTEGEKKALALDQLGLPCVGLTGVWLWLDSEHRAERGDQLHPSIARHVHIAGRAHVIVFDADARVKDDVMQAAARLCGVLYAAGATDVRFVVPPDANAAKGIDDYYCAHGEAATRALLATAQPLEPADPKQPLARVKSLAALRDAPLPDTLRMPAGYIVERDGALWRDAEAGTDNAKPARVTHAPMFITRHLVDHYSGEERADITYQRNDSWQGLCVSRKAIADARSMVAEVAPYGAPVTSVNASKLVDWLHAFEAANDQTIPRVQCVAQTGWHRIDGEWLFTTHAVHRNEESTTQVAIDTRADRRRLFAALAPRGTLDAHLEALRRAFAADPTCAAMICAAAAAPLLRLLGSSNFALHLVGESSRGKTSMLKIAASVFGDPAAPQWLASWNVSLAAAEARAVLLNDLPQLYDEIGCGDAAQIEAMVYGLINGHGRSRATRDIGVRESLSWRTVVLSTGEHDLAPDDAATGAQVRVLQLPVSGFGALGAADIEALVAACAANSGSAGAEWLQHLVNLGDAGSAPLAVSYAALLARMRQGVNGLQGRQAAYFAVLAVTESLLADAFGIGTRTGDTIYSAYTARFAADDADGDGDGSDATTVRGVGERAHELLRDWLLREPDTFPDLQVNSSGEAEPKRGHGKVNGYKRGDTMLVITSAFKEFCGLHRLNWKVVVRELVTLGLCEVTGVGTTKVVRISGSPQRVVVVLPRRT